MKKILFCLLAFYTPVSIVIAQNTTNSPTSMFGLGELSTGEGGQYAGLGGTGIALRGNNFLNNANPASLTELTEQRFQIDAGIMGAYQIYSQRGASNRSVTGNLNNLSIGCRIMPCWYGAIFMAPVSSVGYAITLDEEVAGTNGGTISSLFQDGYQHGLPFRKKIFCRHQSFLCDGDHHTNGDTRYCHRRNQLLQTYFLCGFRCTV